MAFGGGNSYQDQKTLSEINVVPFVNVMLVLLIIFIITAPLLTHSVKINLPKASSDPGTARPERIEFAIRTGKMAHYEHVASVMSLAAKSGLTKTGFITDPARE